MANIDKKQIALAVGKIEDLFRREEDNKRKIATLTKLSKAKEAEVKALQVDNTAINEALTKQVTASDVFTACAIITLSCQSGVDASTKERQAMSRRRKRLIKAAKTQYVDFDIITEKRNNHAVITPKYVGSKLVRQAKALRSQLESMKALGLNVTVASEETIIKLLNRKQAEQATIETASKQLNFDLVQGVLDSARTVAEERQEAHEKLLKQA